MELSAAVVGVWGALTVLALVASAVSLLIHFRTGSPQQIQSLVRQLELDVHEAFDVIEKWTRRDRVRRLREGREPAAEAVPVRGSPEYKQWLRRRARGAGGSGESA